MTNFNILFAGMPVFPNLWCDNNTPTTFCWGVCANEIFANSMYLFGYFARTYDLSNGLTSADFPP